MTIHDLCIYQYCLCRFSSHFSFDMSDNNLVNLYPVGDSIYAASETNYLIKVDAESLDRIDKVLYFIIFIIIGIIAEL